MKLLKTPCEKVLIILQSAPNYIAISTWLYCNQHLIILQSALDYIAISTWLYCNQHSFTATTVFPWTMMQSWYAYWCELITLCFRTSGGQILSRYSVYWQVLLLLSQIGHQTADSHITVLQWLSCSFSLLCAPSCAQFHLAIACYAFNESCPILAHREAKMNINLMTNSG